MSDAAEGRLGPGAMWYAQHGWKIFPVHGIVSGRCTCSEPHVEPKDVGKHPASPNGALNANSDVGAMQTWWTNNPEFNIGVRCRESGFLVIDIDPRNGGPDSFIRFEELVEGALPPTVEATTGVYASGSNTARGRHIFYKCDFNESLVGELKKRGLPGIDIKHNGYVLISPSRHFSGVCYDWAPGRAPWEIEMAEAPDELLDFLRKKGSRNRAVNSSDGHISMNLGETGWEWLDDVDDTQKVDLDKLLEEGIDEGSRAVEIYRMALALSNKIGVDTEVGALAVETMMMRFNAEKVRPPLPLEGSNGLLMHTRRAIKFVQDNPKHTDARALWPELQSWADSRTPSQDGRAAVPVASTDAEVAPIYPVGTDYDAIDNEAVHPSASIGFAANQSLDIPADRDALREEDGGEEGRRSLTDVGNGRRLVDTFGKVIRYTSGLNWFQWDGSYWKPDVENLEIRELAKRLGPIIASEVVNYEDPMEQSEVISWAVDAKSNHRINNAITSATSDPRTLVGPNTWDSSEYLLGVANGVIDLRTGALLEGRPDLYITKRSPVSYSQGLTNTRWQQFVDFATGGDKELQDWLQRAAGYSLTGLRTYDVMFLVYGPPGSGKNTMVEALVKAMGTNEYAWPLDSSILALGDGNSHGTDLYHWAELRGRRMVWVDELPEGERLKENAVKKLTGSSEISARSPGEKPFTFQSRAKLWVTSNHRPIINDDAMWRRIRPVPLNHVPDKPDPDLKSYIFDPEGALPAVLAWAVEGAIKLINSSERDALGTCKAVQDASDIYRKNEDRIGIFLDEETEENVGASVSVKKLYGIYRIWSEERGERAMTQIAFQRKLSDRNPNKVEGQGSRAILLDRAQTLRTATVSAGETDWATVSRFAGA